jgi:hypothetical protein
MILHTVGAVFFFATLWAALQYEGTSNDVPADDGEPTAATCARGLASSLHRSDAAAHLSLRSQL